MSAYKFDPTCTGYKELSYKIEICGNTSLLPLVEILLLILLIVLR